jgi:hypothetical protein
VVTVRCECCGNATASQEKQAFCVTCVMEFEAQSQGLMAPEEL